MGEILDYITGKMQDGKYHSSYERKNTMNIAELRTAPPQTSQYLDAQLLVIGLAKVVNTTRGQRCVQECQVVDRQGQKEKIAYWFDADKPDFAMPQQQLNQWLQWKVKTKPNGQYLNISGYPEKQAQEPQQQGYTPPPQAPPQQQNYTPPPQAPPSPAPAPQPAQTFQQQIEQPDWDEIARGKVRCNLVCAGIQSGQIVVNNPADCNSWMDYIFTGNTGEQGGGENPDYSENPPPPPSDGVPF